MATTKNLCAQIPIALHERVSEERERLGQTTSEYIANLIQDYYNMMENQKGGIQMTEKGRTMAFQIPEELFQRIKRHLERETLRTGKKLIQRDFVLNLITQALDEADAESAAEQDFPAEALPRPVWTTRPPLRTRTPLTRKAPCKPAQTPKQKHDLEESRSWHPNSSGAMTGFLRFKRKEEIAVASEIKRRFTDTEMQIVRETDLLELLTHLGYQVKRIGRYRTTAEMDSLRIKDRRTWFRYSQNTGGDAITLVQQFCDKTFPEAVEYLLTFNGRARDSPAKAVPSVKRDEVQKPFTLPPRNTDDRRVFAYLRKRGIAAQVIRQFMNSGLLYEDAEHHNCVFVGKNSAGQAKYAGLRGTYDRDGKGFRGDVTGSDKNVGFAIPHDPTSDQVRVFEAPIDLMSYLTLHREPINAIALCGLYDGALETYLKDHPSIKRITLCLDADAPGRAAAQQLKDKYSASGYAVTVEEPRSGKDWNEYLQKRNTPERGR